MNLLRVIDDQPERYSLRQLKAGNPNVSFPAEPPLDLLATYDVYPYTVAARASAARHPAMSLTPA
jgi:hypothetical protein